MKMYKAPRNHMVRGRARREAGVPVMETDHEMLLLRFVLHGLEHNKTQSRSKNAAFFWT